MNLIYLHMHYNEHIIHLNLFQANNKFKYILLYIGYIFLPFNYMGFFFCYVHLSNFWYGWPISLQHLVRLKPQRF